MSPTTGDVRRGARLAAQVLRRDPVAWRLACGWWTLFHSLPVATGLALGAVLDEAGLAVPAEQEDEVEKFREFLDHVTPEDFEADR